MRRGLHVVFVAAAVLVAARADAFPAFARKYGMSCSACHIGWPIFNLQGQAFFDNGYQFGLGKDDPVTVSQGYVPFAVRSTAAYTYTRSTNQPSDSGPITVQSGGIPQPGMDLLTGGLIAKDLSFLVVAAGFDDGTATLESAWFRIDNLGGSPWANLKIGKFELDLPASPHRNLTLSTAAPYEIYGAHGSTVAFDANNNQFGLALEGHNLGSKTRYQLAVVTANDSPVSGNGFQSPLVWAHVQQAFELKNPILPWVRVGLSGGVGWWPTTATQFEGADIDGTFTNHKQYYRAGAEVSWMFGYPTTPLFFTAAYMYGKDDKALGGLTDDLGNPTTDPEFSGGFIELNWVPISEVAYNATPYIVIARYDFVRYRNSAFGNDFDGVALVVRRHLALGPRASAAIHAEVSYGKRKGVGADDPNNPGTLLDVETWSGLLGIDFDY